ncbi:trans-2,3-dihydro-3-hydroxyanthranilate isomerase [Granulicella rosea]|uniref:Trans-2,3-dihydro-3-hydroxyanthranilate isomerase n=1 Tax=Granulicella rosea TaxID=474952 RepID=A0A239JSY3_9BACT|nr:PhzF family phenazine biosynthesis protein [Granulicella rosea]SNT07934.1 trans-2,3-dihydro-3-hydroxyanthranilate isomerase [Granulicella rosea]
MSTLRQDRLLDYAQVGVFAERPLEGNMLAIFTDARGLSTAEMQAIARETNLSETTFILPDEGEQTSVRVRIFTTEEELPFAGHPTLGTASWLYLNHPTLAGADEIVLRLNVGPIPVRFRHPAPGERGVYATMRQNDPTFGMMHDPAAVARALGLALDDLDRTKPIQTVSTGLPFCIVPLVSLEAAGRLHIPQGAAQAYLRGTDAKFFYTLTRADKASDKADWHCRMQFGNGEDPATGSASGCAISWLVRHGLAPSGETVVFEQGVEMQRPSRIEVRATVREWEVTDVFVSGRTIPVANGRLILP